MRAFRLFPHVFGLEYINHPIAVTARSSLLRNSETQRRGQNVVAQITHLAFTLERDALEVTLKVRVQKHPYNPAATPFSEHETMEEMVTSWDFGQSRPGATSWSKEVLHYSRHGHKYLLIHDVQQWEGRPATLPGAAKVTAA
jgi:hypothetical protein